MTGWTAYLEAVEAQLYAIDEQLVAGDIDGAVAAVAELRSLDRGSLGRLFQDGGGSALRVLAHLGRVEAGLVAALRQIGPELALLGVVGIPGDRPARFIDESV